MEPLREIVQKCGHAVEPARYFTFFERPISGLPSLVLMSQVEHFFLGGGRPQPLAAAVQFRAL